MRKFKAENIITFTPSSGPRVYLSPLNNSDVITEEGTGMPPIDYITEQGPYQHGVTPKTFRLQPRIIQYRLRQQFCSSAEYTTGRHDLLSLLRPNRPEGITGVLTNYLPNRAIRSLDVAIAEGPAFKARSLGRWDEWAIDEIIRFIAFNPIYYDPTQYSETWVPPTITGFPYTFTFPFTVPRELEFPIEYPIEFYDFELTDVIAYAGNWAEFPTFVITGPAQYIEIRNTVVSTVVTTTTTDTGIVSVVTTNTSRTEKLVIAGFYLGEGRAITIVLTPAAKTVTLDDGTNMQPYVTDDSDLGTFHLEPGDNNFTVIMRGSGVNSRIVMTWKNRYIGI